MNTTTFRVATNNIMSLPLNPQVQGTLDAAPRASVMMIQEADPPSYKSDLRHPNNKRITHTVPTGVHYAEFVLFDPALWDHVSTEFFLAYTGSAGISYTRHIAVTVLHNKAIGQDFAFISYHAVTSGLDRIRALLRGEGDAAVRAQLRRFKAAGTPIILGADLNRTSKVFVSAAIWVRHRIDHVLAWGGSHVHLRENSSHTIATASDHDVLVVEFTATVV